MTKKSIYFKVLLGLLLLLLTSGCYKYSTIQNKFNEASRIDNEIALGFVDPLTRSGDTNLAYEEVEIYLTNSTMDSLDKRLQVNAHTLKALSQWRLGKLKEALATSQRGIKIELADQYPRDKAVLTMILGMICDAQNIYLYKQAINSSRPAVASCPRSKGKYLTPVEYGFIQTENGWKMGKSPYYENYKAAMNAFDQALKTDKAPEDIIEYIHYQKWVALTNWTVISGMICNNDLLNGAKFRNMATEQAQHIIHYDTFQKAAKNERDKVKTPYLRELMEKTGKETIYFSPETAKNFRQNLAK